MTYIFEDFMEMFIIEQEVIPKMVNLLGKTNPSVLNHLLYIIGNLTSRDHLKSKEYFLKNTELKSKLLEFLPTIKPNFIRKNLLWNISNIIHSYSLGEKEYILNILNEDYLKSLESNRGVLREALIIIVSISNTSDEVILDILFKLNIHETILLSIKAISETMENKDIMLQIQLARINCNLTMASPSQIKVTHLFIKKIFKCDFVEIYEDLLTKIINNTDFSKDYKILSREICLCIANIIGTNENLTSIIVKDTRLCELILQLDTIFKDNNVNFFIIFRLKVRLFVAFSML
jgi:hypothetical protein